MLLYLKDVKQKLVELQQIQKSDSGSPEQDFRILKFVNSLVGINEKQCREFLLPTKSIGDLLRILSNLWKVDVAYSAGLIKDNTNSELALFSLDKDWKPAYGWIPVGFLYTLLYLLVCSYDHYSEFGSLSSLSEEAAKKFDLFGTLSNEIWVLINAFKIAYACYLAAPHFDPANPEAAFNQMVSDFMKDLPEFFSAMPASSSFCFPISYKINEKGHAFYLMFFKESRENKNRLSIYAVNLFSKDCLYHSPLKSSDTGSYVLKPALIAVLSQDELSHPKNQALQRYISSICSTSQLQRAEALAVIYNNPEDGKDPYFPKPSDDDKRFNLFPHLPQQTSETCVADNFLACLRYRLCFFRQLDGTIPSWKDDQLFQALVKDATLSAIGQFPILPDKPPEALTWEKWLESQVKAREAEENEDPINLFSIDYESSNAQLLKRRTLNPRDLVPVDFDQLTVQRRALLEGIKAELPLSHSKSKSVILSSFPGYGKTFSAKDYFYRANGYRFKIWFNLSGDTARTEENALATQSQEFLEKQLGFKDVSLHNALRKMKDYLAANGGWLVVIDDLERESSAKGFYPLNGNGHLIVTSNTLCWNETPKLVGNMSIKEAKTLFWKIARSLAPQDPDNPNPIEKLQIEKLEKLLLRLGPMPLLVSHVAACVADPNCPASIEDYLTAVQIKEATKDPTMPSQQAPQSFLSVIKETLSKLETDSGISNHFLDLKRMLWISSFLSSKIISESFFIKIFNQIRLKPIPQGGQDDGRAKNVLRLLVKYHFLEQEDGGYTISQPFQLAIQDELGPEQESGWKMLIGLLTISNQEVGEDEYRISLIQHKNLVHFDTVVFNVLPLSREHDFVESSYFSTYARIVLKWIRINLLLNNEMTEYLNSIEENFESKGYLEKPEKARLPEEVILVSQFYLTKLLYCEYSADFEGVKESATLYEQTTRQLANTSRSDHYRARIALIDAKLNEHDIKENIRLIDELKKIRDEINQNIHENESLTSNPPCASRKSKSNDNAALQREIQKQRDNLLRVLLNLGIAHYQLGTPDHLKASLSYYKECQDKTDSTADMLDRFRYEAILGASRALFALGTESNLKLALQELQKLVDHYIYFGDSEAVLVSDCLDQMAEIQCHLPGQLSEAMQNAEKSLKIKEDKLPMFPYRLVYTKNLLAYIIFTKDHDRLAEVIFHLDESLKILGESGYKSLAIDLATVQWLYATILTEVIYSYIFRGKPLPQAVGQTVEQLIDQALNFFEISLKTRKKWLTDGHPDTQAADFGIAKVITLKRRINKQLADNLIETKKLENQLQNLLKFYKGLGNIAVAEEIQWYLADVNVYPQLLRPPSPSSSLYAAGFSTLLSHYTPGECPGEWHTLQEKPPSALSFFSGFRPQGAKSLDQSDWESEDDDLEDDQKRSIPSKKPHFMRSLNEKSLPVARSSLFKQDLSFFRPHPAASYVIRSRLRRNTSIIEKQLQAFELPLQQIKKSLSLLPKTTLREVLSILQQRIAQMGQRAPSAGKPIRRREHRL